MFPRRKSIRLKGYDYTRSGAYFVTICAANRQYLFSKIVNDRVILNQIGRLVNQIWIDLIHKFPNIVLDDYIIMPDHIHGIIFINSISKEEIQNKIIPIGMNQKIHSKSFDQINCTDLINQIRTINAIKNDHGKSQWILMKSSGISLGKIIRYFKAKCTREIRSSGYSQFTWHRLYYDHIIRNESDLSRIRWYIKNNPCKWNLVRNHNLRK